jgi:4-diphosphocytidyl-2-C-methyl-D-erythritol kinase
LQKRIPVGGGLGGGSSNAATVLLALRHFFGTPPSRSELVSVARELGADVPYFLVGGTALGTGRGDDIERLADLPERQVLLVTPPVRISTASVFGKLGWPVAKDRRELKVDPTTMATDWQVASHGWNDLEPVVLANYDQVQGVYNVLVEAGAAVVRLSGSGSTLFALIDDEVEASGLAERLAERLPPDCRVVRTRTLTRSALETKRVVQ